MPLSTQVYKWVPANLMLEGNPAMELASHPGGSRNTPSRFMPLKPELSDGPTVARMQTLPVYRLYLPFEGQEKV